MSVETPAFTFNLQDPYETLGYLLGRYHRSLNLFKKGKILYQAVMHMTDEDLEEAGLKRDCLDEVMKEVFFWDSYRTWPTYHYSKSGEESEEYCKEAQQTDIKRRFWLVKKMSPVARKLGDFLQGKGISIPVDVIGKPPTPTAKTVEGID